ncbi:MAG: hypothetical protein Q8747_02035 [Candidatus Phytoplasma australasiaticum]|uniref:Uncharacterized protein n=1 Tax=Candidatus Phytoplasma australasiaticum subsp. australasiaticum TaxID=2832407 RepID=A0A9K3STJ8_9MOLU|nr:MULTISPECIES: hypothetical protein [Phytoplasma]MDV3155052.1 hypothetical protein [Sweet potato little leaf phytoplasma]MDO8031011.1 hypothetical protein [Candidatus Phytoplasma australasiaticum]MDO8031521.1 hypothetical protein [Candidatus Phytoplasma australasiaticum]MDO8046563.1 hypothetical protein [Candidatus Phytoplasma australasiaticum]MDO8053119.1 hypothetical protein [Candidatus Phytoplasma australasiaticum]
MKIRKITEKPKIIKTNSSFENKLTQGNEELSKTTTTLVKLETSNWFTKSRDGLIILFILLSIFTQFCERKIPWVNYGPKSFKELITHEIKKETKTEVKKPNLTTNIKKDDQKGK